MAVSGLFLAFFKGWSLALPMLLLAPMMFFGLNLLIKGATQQYIKTAAAYAKCASFSDEALNAIKIVAAFGMEQLETENFKRFLGGYNEVAVSVAVKTGFSFGFFLFTIYFGYSYAFFIGSIWVDQEFWNHAVERPYSAGDIISVFFGVFFGMMALGGLAPNIQGLAEAKASGQKAFYIIDRIPAINIDDPHAEDHKL